MDFRGFLYKLSPKLVVYGNASKREVYLIICYEFGRSKEGHVFPQQSVLQNWTRGVGSISAALQKQLQSKADMIISG